MAPRTVPHVIRIGSSRVRSEVFDYTGHIATICRRIVADTPELAHVRMDRIATAFSYARGHQECGMYASLTPLRFPGGQTETRRRGRAMRIQSVVDATDVEMLYILTLYLPRFENQTFREKLITLFHELWHVSPAFDGDIRRHEGRNFAHGSSREEYDRRMGVLTDRWLANRPDFPELERLRLDYASLWKRHPKMTGLKLPRIRLFATESPKPEGAKTKPPR